MTDTATREPMLADYSSDIKPGWEYSYDGHHFAFNSRFGVLEIGMVPGAPYDQWLFHENNGGGSLVIGFVRQGNQLMVMMLKANRFNLKGDQDDWELPGGFVDEGETKLNTAIRETIEETDQLANPYPVSGRGFVGNRAFFQLRDENEGTSVFAFELTPEQVEATNRSPKLQLMSWQDAIRTTRDALSGMAIGRFVADTLV